MYYDTWVNISYEIEKTTCQNKKSRHSTILISRRDYFLLFYYAADLASSYPLDWALPTRCARHKKWLSATHTDQFALLLPAVGKFVQHLGQRYAFGGFAGHYCRNDVGSKVDQWQNPCHMGTVWFEVLSKLQHGGKLAGLHHIGVLVCQNQCSGQRLLSDLLLPRVAGKVWYRPVSGYLCVNQVRFSCL